MAGLNEDRSVPFPIGTVVWVYFVIKKKVWLGTVNGYGQLTSSGEQDRRVAFHSRKSRYFQLKYLYHKDQIEQCAKDYNISPTNRIFGTWMSRGGYKKMESYSRYLVKHDMINHLQDFAAVFPHLASCVPRAVRDHDRTLNPPEVDDDGIDPLPLDDDIADLELVRRTQMFSIITWYCC